MDLALYLLTTERDPRTTRVAGAADLSRLPLPVLVYGERLNVTIYLLDAANTYNAISGAAGYAPTLSLGRRGESALATTTTFTRITNGWTCTLDLNTNELAFALKQASGGLALSFKTVASGPQTDVWLSGDIKVLAEVGDPAAGTPVPPTAYYTAAETDILLAAASDWPNITSKPASISSLAALPPAADRLAYFTGATTAALTTLSAYGRSLIAAADATAAKTLLALVKADVGLGSVENTALSTWAGSTAITTIGTLAAGTVPVARVSGLAASATTDTTNAANISSGTLPLARLSGITTTQLSATAGIVNAQLANSAITFGATSVSLGATVSALNSVAIGSTTPSTGAFTTLSATGGTTTLGPGSGAANAYALLTGGTQESWFQVTNSAVTTGQRSWRFGTATTGGASFVGNAFGLQRMADNFSTVTDTVFDIVPSAFRFTSAYSVAHANTTDSTSTTTGGSTFAGGVGIAKTLYVGTSVNTPIVQSLSAGSLILQDATASNKITLGTSGAQMNFDSTARFFFNDPALASASSGTLFHTRGGSTRSMSIAGTVAGNNIGYVMQALSANSTARSGGVYFEPNNTLASQFIGLSVDNSSYQHKFFQDGSALFTGPLALAGAAVSASTGLVLPVGTTALSSLRIPHGAAPTTPVNGDIWTTTTGLFVRINGVTVGPLT